jgi:hypothetical protein
MHGIRLFGFVMLASAMASAQTTAVQVPAPAKAGEAAEIAPAPAAAAPAPEIPKRPVEMPARPPKVTCHGDQITISADNSTLDAILFAVRGCTGAKIDVPGDASRVRTFEELGPGPVREVLDDLLSGTPYNYVIQSSEANPLKVETVLLSMRTEGTDKGGASASSISTDIPSTPGRRAWKLMQKFDKPDPATLNGDDGPAESDAATPAEQAAATAAASNTADENASPANANQAAPVEAAAVPAPSPALTPVAAPIINPNSNADPAKSMQDRISQMQQMFAQRQQMMKSQGQTPGAAPQN